MYYYVYVSDKSGEVDSLDDMTTTSGNLVTEGYALSEYTVDGLGFNQKRFINVIVEDGAGNRAAYTAGEGSSLEDVSDVTDPTAGDSGTITATGGEFQIEYTWTAATDTETPLSDLYYYVYASESNNISDVAAMQANGTLVNEGKGLTSHTLTGLGYSETWYLNVYVVDCGNNTAAYTAAGDITDPDDDPPVPGDSGTVTALGGNLQISLSWTAATDLGTAQNDLYYEIITSTSGNIATLADISANGTSSGNGTGITSYTLDGLTYGDTRYVTIVVSDAEGNPAVYTMTSATTNSCEYGSCDEYCDINASWDSTNCLDDYCVYYLDNDPICPNYCSMYGSMDPDNCLMEYCSSITDNDPICPGYCSMYGWMDAGNCPDEYCDANPTDPLCY